MIFNDRAKAEPARKSVADALECERHRGPDETDMWVGDGVVFGFNRLGFIDLENSHQPLVWGPKEAPFRYTLIFNGEIYNFRELRSDLADEFGITFDTDGDGEAIIAAYHCLGAGVVDRLRGMFAFVIWDSHEDRLFAARDPFGIKPLYYATGSGGLAFSSEKKSLLHFAGPLGIDASEVDRVAVQHYAALQYAPEPETLHRDIRRVESGSYFEVCRGGPMKFIRYFQPEFKPVALRSADEEEKLYGRIAGALRDSVANHMIADQNVTVGAFLSGGIDSTATTTLAKEHNPNLIAFTAGFDHAGYSEVDVAAKTAAEIGVEHVVRIVSAEDVMRELPLIVWYLDDAIADPALVPFWFIAREARKRVKAVISGEGADELFGGYQIYREPLSLAPFEKLPSGVRRIIGGLSAKLPEGVRGKDLLRRGSLPLEERYYGNARNFSDGQLRAVMRSYIDGAAPQDVTAPWYALSRGQDPVARMQHVDLFTWLRGDILPNVDKVTMANSLELRVPFLDPEVFKVAAEIPTDQKFAGGTSKFALRQALKSIVPAHVLERPKLGFPVPIRLWLKDEMYDWARAIISDSGAGDLLNLDAAKALLEEHRKGPHDRSRQLWTLLVFMLWHGIFIEHRLAPEIPQPAYPVSM